MILGLMMTIFLPTTTTRIECVRIVYVRGIGVENLPCVLVEEGPASTHAGLVRAPKLRTATRILHHERTYRASDALGTPNQFYRLKRSLVTHVLLCLFVIIVWFDFETALAHLCVARVALPVGGEDASVAVVLGTERDRQPLLSWIACACRRISIVISISISISITESVYVIISVSVSIGKAVDKSLSFHIELLQLRGVLGYLLYLGLLCFNQIEDVRDVRVEDASLRFILFFQFMRQEFEGVTLVFSMSMVYSGSLCAHALHADECVTLVAPRIRTGPIAIWNRAQFDVLCLSLQYLALLGVDFKLLARHHSILIDVHAFDSGVELFESTP